MPENETSIAVLEGELGARLPDDYRAFLLALSDSMLDRPLVFNAPRSGIVDAILTIDEILENSRNERIGIPEKQLMHIGGNLMGGYLYLKVGKVGFGQVHYMENYTFREVFDSFSQFLKETHEEAEPSS